MRLRSAPLSLLSLPALSLAVSLADFEPRATNLPESCQSVYTSQISGCQGSDFQGSSCSAACVDGLEALVNPVMSACGNQGLQGENIIVAYLNNVGPSQLCPDADAILASQMGASGNTAPATTASNPSTVPWSTTAAQSPTRQPVIISSSTRTASSLSAQPTSLLVDSSSTTAAPVATSSTATTSAHPTSSSSVNPQTNLNDGSGGGSPFDTQGNVTNSASAPFGALAALKSLACLSSAIWAALVLL